MLRAISVSRLRCSPSPASAYFLSAWLNLAVYNRSGSCDNLKPLLCSVTPAISTLFLSASLTGTRCLIRYKNLASPFSATFLSSQLTKTRSLSQSSSTYAVWRPLSPPISFPPG
jgi:hypothetical protein